MLSDFRVKVELCKKLDMANSSCRLADVDRQATVNTPTHKQVFFSSCVISRTSLSHRQQHEFKSGKQKTTYVQYSKETNLLLPIIFHTELAFRDLL